MDILLAVLLAVSTVLLYRKVTRLWWTYDDAFLLHIAAEHPARDHFIGPAIWRSMPQRLFTPLLTASYDAELSLFGAAAGRFYEVHLGLLAILTVVLFAAVRMWLPPPAAASVALTFIAGAPLCSLATELMLVHYIESLILAAASTLLFALAVRRRSIALSLVSSSLYFAAMLAKEIAVPLVAVLLLLPEGTLRHRLRIATPHAAALLGYLLWRRAALGEWIGGYGWTIGAGDLPRVAAALPAAVFHALAGPSMITGSILLAVVAIGIGLRIRSARSAAVIVAMLALSIAPILPMAKKFESRFAVVVWLACATIATAGYAGLRDRKLQQAMLCIVPMLAIAGNRQAWSRDYSQSRKMSDEARVFFELRQGDALRKPAVPPAAMGELKWLKETYSRRPAGAQWFYDDIFLCVAPMPRRVFEWTDARHEVVERTDMAAIRDRYCATIRGDARLNASFHHQDESLFWTFGPYDRGAYGIVIGDGVQAFDLPRSDGFRLPGVTALQLRVRYKSPEGWVTYSPELSLDFSQRADFQWHR